MAKTLAQKFFIKSGNRIAVINAPEKYLTDTLVDLPDDVTPVTELDGQFDAIQVFVTMRGDLVEQVEALKAALKEGGVIWFCYPKGGDKASINTDLNRDKLWQILTEFSLKPNHQIAVDDTWSALRFKVDA